MKELIEELENELNELGPAWNQFGKVDRMKSIVNKMKLRNIVNFDVEIFFNNLRMDKNFHLGMGDVRLTKYYQDKIVDVIKSKKK